jgi:argininosuccinate lyase
MTDLADYFVQEYKITFREAHHIVAAFVKSSISAGKKSNN